MGEKFMYTEQILIVLDNNNNKMVSIRNAFTLLLIIVTLKNNKN